MSSEGIRPLTSRHSMSITPRPTSPMHSPSIARRSILPWLRLLLSCLVLCSAAFAVEAPPEEDPTVKKRGPFYSGCIRWRSEEDVIAYKGIVITLGKDADAYVCYDSELVRPSLGWVANAKGYGLKVPRFNSPLPSVAGTVAFGNSTLPATTATFSTSGTYILRVSCSDSLLTAFDEAQITVNPTGGGGGATVAVYAGYYDTHHPYHTMPKPNPWQGAANTVFVGAPDSSSGGWDSSAVRVDNLTSSTLTGVTVTVDIGSSRFALWGQRSIPAGSSLILAQTGSGKFDGSDRNTAGCYDCAGSLCTTAISSTIPVVHVTVGATTINVPDSGQIINTRGADSAGCPFYGHGIRSDESESWLQIH